MRLIGPFACSPPCSAGDMPEKLAFTQLKRSLEVILLLKFARKKIAGLRNVTDEFVTELRQVTDFRRISLSRHAIFTNRKSIRSGCAGTTPLRTVRRPTYAELLHPVHQRGPFHPEARCCSVPSADHPIACFQCSNNVIPFHLR